MDRIELEQKSRFKTEAYKITETGLETYLKDYEGVFTRFYHFDDFSRRTNRTFTETEPKFLKIGIGIITLGIIIFKCSKFFENIENVLMLSGLISAIVGLCLVAYFFLNRKQNFLLEMDNDEQVFILMDKPNKVEVEEFIETFYKKRKEYYRERYFYIDFKGKREQEISRIKWLKDEDIISKIEYDETMNKMDNVQD